MTEHEKDKAAYEACGYRWDPIPGETAVVVRHDRYANFYASDPSHNWSSADAAIAHAERGGFHVYELYDSKCLPGMDTDLPRFDVTLMRNRHRYFGRADSVGLAIRNAVAEVRKDKNP